MRVVLIALLMSAGFTASADDFGVLKDAAQRYVAAMKAAGALSDDSACSDTIAKAEEYASAKVAYRRVARKVMPTAIQGSTSQDSGNSNREELADIFRGFGADKDEEVTKALAAKLAACPASEERDHAAKAVAKSAEDTRPIRRGRKRYRTHLKD